MLFRSINIEELEHYSNVVICSKESGQMSLESMNDHIVKGLNSALEAVSPPTSKQKIPQKLSSETLDLIEQRRKLLADKDFDKSETSRLQREIRRNIRRDLRHHDEIIIKTP